MPGGATGARVCRKQEGVAIYTPLAYLRIGVIALAALGCDTFADPGHSDQLDPPPTSVPPPSAGFPGVSSGGSGGFTGGLGRLGGMCFQCAPGCQDCGVGCQCTVPPEGPEPWNDPFVPNAEPGWRDSSIPFCSELASTFTSGVWSNGDSVFALVSGVSNRLDGANPAADTASFNSVVLTRLFRNDGDGWSPLADTQNGSSTVKLSGIPPDTAVTYDSDGSSSDCLLAMFNADGERSCVVPTNGTTGVSSVPVIGEDRAYALQGGATLLVWDGTQWSEDPLPPPLFAEALWADDDELVAIGESEVMRRTGEELWSLENLDVEHLTALWARGVNDVWIGTIDGRVLHFDGKTWQEIATLRGVTCNGLQPVKGITGADDDVWIWGDRLLMRFDGEQLETFGNWSCLSSDSPDMIGSVWANAPDDVFVSVSNAQGATRCGSGFIVHYDGEAFHRF